MKKLLLFLLLLSAPAYAIDTAVVGTMWKQEGTTVLPADDVIVVDFNNISTIGITAGAQEGTDVKFGNMSTGFLNVSGLLTVNYAVDLLDVTLLKTYFRDVNGGIMTIDPNATINVWESDRAARLSAAALNARIELANTIGFNAAGSFLQVVGEATNSTGTYNHASILATYSTTGDSSATDLLINRTENFTGSGPQLLIDAQVGSVSRFSVDNNGSSDTGGAVAFSGISTATADYAIGDFADDPTYFIECDATLGNISTTLPPVADKKGRLLEVKLLSSSNGCYLDGNGAETIDGAAGQAITIQYNAISLIAGSSEWLIY